MLNLGTTETRDQVTMYVGFDPESRSCRDVAAGCSEEEYQDYLRMSRRDDGLVVSAKSKWWMLVYTTQKSELGPKFWYLTNLEL